MILISQPGAGWFSVFAMAASGLAVAAGARRAAGMSLAICSSCSVVAFASIAPGKRDTSGSARNRANGAGSQRFVSTIRSP